MPIYTLDITWLHSTEHLLLDTHVLREGATVTTRERWTGEEDEHQYSATVVAFSANDKKLSVTLRYDQDKNQGVENDSWGESAITLDLSKARPAGSARWKDDAIQDYTGKAPEVYVTRQTSVAEDLEEIERSAPATEREARILARIGQGGFRDAVTQAWGMGKRCALTKIAVPELPIASHILPWSESTDRERLDPANGLLLATHVDKLFDRYLLSFEEADGEYRVKLNPRISKVAESLGIKADATLPVHELSEDRREAFAGYMRLHFERFSAKCRQEAADDAQTEPGTAAW